MDEVEICGDRLGLSLRLDVGGEQTAKLVLVDWPTSQAVIVRT